MRGFDLTPYRRSTVGFDRLFDLIENNARVSQGKPWGANAALLRPPPMR
jgi:hypothetical protein